MRLMTLFGETPSTATFLQIASGDCAEPNSSMAVRVFALMAAVGFALAGCGDQPAAQNALVTNVKDGCNQDSDSAFLSKAAVAAPFKWSRELEHDEFLLTVDPGQWNNLGYGMRQQIIAIFDCANAGPGKYHSDIIIRSVTDGTDLMKVSTPELMQWRAAGLADLKPDGLRAEAVATDALVPNGR